MALITLAQNDCRLGEIEANLTQAVQLIGQAATANTDLVVFPELSLHGYALGRLPSDQSIRANDPRLPALSQVGPDVVAGFHEDGGIRRYNSAAYLASGAIRGVHRKLYPVNYLAWEERKHVSPGQALRTFDTRIGRVATLICNDAWQPVVPWLAAQDGAEVLLIPTNSAAEFAAVPLDIIQYWNELLRFIARMQQCWVVFCNRVGAEEGARFWGGSRILDPDGQVVAQAPLWEPALLTAEIDVAVAGRRRREVPLLADARLGLLSRELTRLINTET